jgi:hypothetical protein
MCLLSGHKEEDTMLAAIDERAYESVTFLSSRRASFDIVTVALSSLLQLQRTRARHNGTQVNIGFSLAPLHLAHGPSIQFIQI